MDGVSPTSLDLPWCASVSGIPWRNLEHRVPSAWNITISHIPGNCVQPFLIIVPCVDLQEHQRLFLVVSATLIPLQKYASGRAEKGLRGKKRRKCVTSVSSFCRLLSRVRRVLVGEAEHRCDGYTCTGSAARYDRVTSCANR